MQRTFEPFPRPPKQTTQTAMNPEMTFKPVRRISEYRHTYARQNKPQRAYFELCENDNEVIATYDGAIGGAIPFEVFHKRDLRFYFSPELKMREVNQLGRDLLPLFARVRAGQSVQWDGNNHVGRFTDDAIRAIDAIEKAIEEMELSHA